MVLVNTVLLVRSHLALPESAVAWTLFAFGAGSMAAALMLPRLLEDLPDRLVMVAGAALATATLGALALGLAAADLSWPVLLASWVAVGLGYAAVLTPTGRLLRRSSHPEDRPALFAAQFALSHACWLATYPLAGWLMTAFGPVGALTGLAALAAAGALAALRLWPAGDPVEMSHRHDDLPPDHPNLQGHAAHRHPYVIDDLHQRWPSSI